MMNTFNMNVEKANNLVEKVWSHEFSMPHKNFLNGWAENKKSYLAEIFGGELILSKEVTIEQSVDAMYSQINDFRWNLINIIEKQDWYNKDMWHELREMITVDSLYENKINSNFSFGEKRKFSKGEKLTRGFKKLISDSKIVEKQQILYSQMMNTKKLTGNLCLSIHPMDFLTMSYTSTWNSCFNVFEYGEYRAGALEFMFAENTICAYLTTKDLKLPGGFDWNDKKWRCILNVKPNDYIMTGKNYPYKSDELTELAYEWVRELMGEGFPTFKDTVALDDIEYHDVNVEFGYNDADYCSELFFVGRHESVTQDCISVDYNGIVCPECGEHGHDFGSENVMCECCDDSFYCECCEDRMNGESYEVHNCWGDTIYVCEYCRDEYYSYCDSCGEYHHDDYMIVTEDGCRYCEDCRDVKAFFCEKCEYWFRNVDKNVHKGNDLCPSCYRDALEEEEEEDEE